MAEKWFCRWLLLVLAWSVGAPAVAAQVEGLFTSQQDVEDQTADQRAAALEKGLAEVLVRVSGHERVLQTSSVETLLGDADRYLAQFSYHENAGEALSEGASAARYKMSMRFDKPGIIRFLSEAGLPVWGDNRPNVLVWLAVAGPNGRFVVNDEGNPLLSDIMAEEARRRGVPLTLPLMDLEDERRVSVSDIWGQFSDRISTASVRYAPDAIYSGRFYRDASGWLASWSLQIAGERQSFTLKADQIRELFSVSVDALAEALADKYAVEASGGASKAYRFRVSGLDSVAGYARLNHYLSGLQIVERVEVLQVDDAITYQVQLKGGIEQFRAVLALESLMRADKGQPAGEVPRFFWQPES